MTPENISLLRSKQWIHRAKGNRPIVGQIIAEAIGKSQSEIIFTDENVTKLIAEYFMSHNQVNKDIEFSNRDSAVDYVMKVLGGITGQAYYLSLDYENTGAISLDFSEAIGNIDALLQCQHEYFCLIFMHDALLLTHG